MLGKRVPHDILKLTGPNPATGLRLMPECQIFRDKREACSAPANEEGAADRPSGWRARRALSTSDGPLQQATRGTLARVADGPVPAGQTAAVTEQIEAPSGFSQDGFRRTVLLAQGDVAHVEFN